eukprot:TRINITY_DN65196_c0_g1_i1.p1 TRINITY_DN65196_c0_g1~~TRINITY_DN65196_c0_g1_i1.p1  ORF type:complete len:241 (+),score=51.42 TRINITY_DN65196_c0_g1_i1:73-795(+)
MEPGAKSWGGFAETFRDHGIVLKHIPKIFDAYVGSNRIDPELAEAVMLAVNSANSCSYCTGLHCELGRMAGVEGARELNAAVDIHAATAIKDVPGVSYGRVFGEDAGFGKASENGASYERIRTAYGAGKAASLRALCWFLHWGSYGGNTLDGILCRKAGKPGASLLFKLLFLIYYGPLFLIIALVSCLLKPMPKVPKWFSAFFGAFLALVASCWILLPGLLGLMCFPPPKKGLLDDFISN